MDIGFWKKVGAKKPFFVLAPMADVTDCAFRRIIAKHGKPDVMWTEFVSADGLAHAEGREHLLVDLAYTEKERPIVAQLFTAHPDKMREAARLIAELGFDGLDINMGCPDRSIEKQGAGAALIKTPKIAREVIRAAKQGIAEAGKDIPVSVKTRIGWSKPEMETWIPELLSEGLAALTIHARTRKELSLVPARWEFVKRAVEIRNEMKVDTLIIGNGDVKDLSEAKARAKETGADGVMIGRGIFGNPWCFDPKKKDISIREKLEVMVEHTKLFEKLLGGKKNFALMKKHYKAYVNGFDGAKELRVKLMEAEDAKEVGKIVKGFLEASFS
jgi:nifR3 family TIM-barrel protein